MNRSQIHIDTPLVGTGKLKCKNICILHVTEFVPYVPLGNRHLIKMQNTLKNQKKTEHVPVPVPVSVTYCKISVIMKLVNM